MVLASANVDMSVLYKVIEVDKEFLPHPPKGNIFILLHLCYLFSIGYLKINVIFLSFVGKYYIVDAGIPIALVT
jgi:hypothetical protein